MRYLVLKELLLQKGKLLLGLMYAFFFSFIFRSMGEARQSRVMIAIAYALVIMGAGSEIRNSSDTFWNSLPVAKWKVVGSKYVSTLICIILATALSWLANLALHRLSLVSAASTTPRHVIIAGIVVGVWSSVYWPFHFASGHIKVRYLHLILLFVAIAVVDLALVVLNPEELFNLIVLLGFAALALVSSFMCALHFYKRREF